MFCKNCGSQIDHPGAFCPYCGSKMEADSYSAREPKQTSDPFCNPQTPPQTPPSPAYVPPAYHAPAPNSADNSQTLGILSLVFAFLIPLVGLILGIVGKRQAKENGNSSAYGLAKAGFIVSLVFMIIWILVVILYAGVVAAWIGDSAYYYALLPKVFGI